MKQDFLTTGSFIGSAKDGILLGWGKKGNFNDSPKFYFPHYFFKGDPWITHKNYQQIQLNDFMNLFRKDSQMFVWNNPYKKIFEHEFHRLKDLFNSKILKKAVPYIFIHSKAKIDLENTLRTVLEFSKNTPSYVYGSWDEKGGIIGCTPEILFQINGKELNTVACAGTRSENKEWSEKDHHEHQWVIEGIKESLNGDIEIKKTVEKNFGNLYHLVTSIKAIQHEKWNFLDCVKALHPTPALGAYPKKSGGVWLKDYDKKVPRNRFGAPVGYVWKEKSLCAVAIRNVQWVSNVLSIGAGCGVVQESQLEDEWNEILLKLEATKQLLGLC